MKPFRFRLETALRWREAQAGLERNRVAAAAAQLAEIAGSAASQKTSLAGARRDLSASPCASVMQPFAAYSAVASARIRDLDNQAAVARRNVALAMNRLIEARRKARLLESLKEDERNTWRRDFERELALFADEAFLNRRR